MAGSACTIGGDRHTYIAPAPEPDLFEGTDALVISSTFKSHLNRQEPVRGAGAGASAAAGDWFYGGLEELSGSGGGIDGGVGYVLALIVTTPIAAAVGAARARSGDEVDDAAKIYKTVPSQPESQRSLAERIAHKVRDAAPMRWTCVEAATPTQQTPCPNATTPLTLSVETKVLTGEWDGRIDPDFSMNFYIEAELGRRASEPFVMRWRYIGEKESYFDLAKKDGSLLKQRIDALLNEFATAVARDAILDPKPYVYEVWGSGPYCGDLVEPIIGAVHRGVFCTVNQVTDS